MNKNVVIFILVVFTILGSIWGSVANKKRITTEKELSATVAEIEKLNTLTSKEREQILGKTAGIQEDLDAREEQLQKARKELVSLRKTSQGLESKFSGCTSSLQVAQKKNTDLSNKLTTVQKKNTDLSEELKATQNAIETLKGTVRRQAGEAVPVPEKKPVVAVKKVEQEADKKKAEQVRVLEEKLQSAEVTVEHLQENLNAAHAQIIGLEKIIDEKNAAMDETALEMDRLKINMDVLLSKVAEQQDEIQEIQEEKRELVKELAAKNEEIADCQEEVMQKPVQQQ